METFLVGIYLWVCLMMGVDPKSIPMPSILIATQEQMVTLQCGRDTDCKPAPVANDRVKGKFTIIVVEDIQDRGIIGSSWVVHHFVHYIQLHAGFKGNLEKFADPRYKDFLEEQALDLQKLYLKSISI